MDPERFNWNAEIKLFLEFFTETFLLLITVQLISDKVNNNTIQVLRDAKTALLIAVIVYIAQYINVDAKNNILQGFHYAISGVFLSKYVI